MQGIKEVYMTAEEYYYEQRTQGIYPTQHTPLIEPARVAHETHHRMADARRDYLQTHPYAYKNNRKADHHKELRDRAYTDAATYRTNYDDHVRYAADESRDEFDRFGRRRPVCYVSGSSPERGYYEDEGRSSRRSPSSGPSGAYEIVEVAPRH